VPYQPGGNVPGQARTAASGPFDSDEADSAEALQPCQGRGIDIRLIGAFAGKAQENGRDLVLEVLTVNRRAQALFWGRGRGSQTR
jgi:ribosomal protein S18 acetylase RimI-like enzyme